MEERLVCTVGNENMEPTLMWGDQIACVKADLGKLSWHGGCIHLIIFTDGTKTIKRVIDQGDSILLKGDGANGMRQAIPKKYIKEIYRVVASARWYE